MPGKNPKADGSAKMTLPGFRSDVVDALDRMLQPVPGVALKLPRERIATLLERPGFAPFMPFGQKVMKEWVLMVRDEPGQFETDLPLFEEAIAFVAGQVK